MDGAQVGIFEETDQVGFRGLLESSNSRRLESKIGLVILSDLTHETLEGKLADEEIGGLLVLADLTKSDSSGSVTVRLFMIMVKEWSESTTSAPSS